MSGTVGVDLDHGQAGVHIDVVDSEHERAACADLRLIAGLDDGASPIDTTDGGVSFSQFTPEFQRS
ncbi:hypothetical protein [Rhodococcus rhodochrous]|uniref:hypothetical protein n=1 Tax=Rhodococcus rhodochrous TaxID=1829 RepID=UPI0015C4118E|nr:hypothetical protein [Rhodococcus rhodochrous]